MGRVLAVDMGDVRTGLALSDLYGITCRPLTVIHEKRRDSLIRNILEIAEENQVESILVGLPRPLRGGSNSQLRRTLGFVGELRASSEFPVNTWDERYTSKLAAQTLDTMGGGKGPDLDAVAAGHLLQDFLNSLASDGAQPPHGDRLEDGQDDSR